MARITTSGQTAALLNSQGINKMKVQAKQLKAVLTSLKITRNSKTALSVNTTKIFIKKINGKNVYEYGRAECHTDALTNDQITAIKTALPYSEIYNNVECNFAIIKN